MLEDWFKVVKDRFNVEEEKKPPFKCPRCQQSCSTEKIAENMWVCPVCNYHSRMTAQDRLEITADKDSFTEINGGLLTKNPISFPEYEDKISSLQEATGLKEAVITGECTIKGERCVIGIMDSHFMMASMGSVVGEKITRAFEYAGEKGLPLVLFTASGGARMQEGLVSLMQMAKTSGAAAKFSEQGGLYITVLTDPTTGGVTASFASLGDVIIAEPRVLVGFAGRRVIEGTINQRLPDDFQSAEFLMENGFVDMITERKDMRRTLSHLIRLHKRGGVISPDKLTLCEEYGTERSPGEKEPLTPYERLQIIRNKQRPTVRDYIPLIFTDIYEMRGDRYHGDDRAVFGAVCRFGGMPVTVIAEVKGRDVYENKETNFAMPHPEGYRKAMRLARQAEKFGRPVICFIDTPGAYCGVGAEKRGQGEAIARSMYEFMRLKVPVISIVLGEGGSGGALALGVCDELAMLENAIYSVISPRGFASLLWKDPSREKEACNIMRITAEDAVELGVAEAVIPEPDEGAHTDVEKTAQNISEFLANSLKDKMEKDIDLLLDTRYNKFRKIGVFTEE